MKIALVQMNALADKLEPNLVVHARYVAQARRLGCDLVVFPELSTSAHFGGEDVVRFAEALGRGPIFDTMKRLATQHKIVIAYGFCERLRGTFFNSHLLIGPQGVIGCQRKIHASKDEYFTFRMGDELPVFEVNGWRIGSLICYDSCFDEAWRSLALQDADLILLPHATRSGWGRRIPLARQRRDAKAAQAMATRECAVRTKANAVFAAFVNQVGWNGHSTHAGGIVILDPMGEVVGVGSGGLGEQMVTATLDLALVETARRSPHCTLKTRRPEVYRRVNGWS